MVSFPRPRPPVEIDPVLDDAGLVRKLATRHAPYWSVQRYFSNLAEMASYSRAGEELAARDGQSLGDGAPQQSILPWFRGDWAYDTPLVDGVEPILASPRFAEAARRVFDGAIVRPQIVYINLNLPMRGVDPGHTDVPAFRGVDRTRHPIWLLAVMLKSGLFDRWRVPIATGVSWYYEGEGGGFCYWPDGADAAPVSRPCRSNTALVGDNDIMFHRVESVGGPGARKLKGLTLDSQLVWAGDAWEVVSGTRTLGRAAWEDVRISISWKAQVFRDAEEARVYDEHEDDLTLDQTVTMLVDDLRRRGVEGKLPGDPLADAAWIATLNRTYAMAPPRPPEAASA